MLHCSAAVSACGTGSDLLIGYDLPPETENVQGDWPRLVDAPQAPPPGSYSAATPDPAQGQAILGALSADAAAAAAVAETLSGPVIPPDEAERLRRAGGG